MFLTALLALLWATVATAQTVGPPQVVCNAGFIIDAVTGPVARTRIIQATAGHHIHVCGWNVSNTGGAAVTMLLSGGGGTNCSDTPVAWVAVTVGNGQSNIDHTPVASIRLRQDRDVCWTITGAGTLSGTIYYGIYP